MSARPGLAQAVEDGGHQLHVRPGQDREPHAVHVLGHGRGHDLLRGQPDALVDHLEAGVAGSHGDLLGAVGVAVEARLADQQAQPAAELLAGGLHPLPDRGQVGAGLGHCTAPETPVGARYSPNTSRSVAGPLPRGRPGAGRDQGGCHQVLVVVAAAASAASACGHLGARRARPSTPRHGPRRRAPRSGSAVMIAPSRSAVSGDGSVDSYLLTPTMTSSPDSMRRAAGGVRGDQLLLHVDSTAAIAPPISCTRSISALAPRRARRPWPR
jgi:hypothetical protein